MMKVFLTGGAGYIGAHTLIELLEQGCEVCVFDNHSNSSPDALSRVRALTGVDFRIVQGDLRDADAIGAALLAFRPDTVIHLAGLKAVGESTRLPLDYYDNNVQGSIMLLRAMDAAGCSRLVFSSSATVYGPPVYLPYDEGHPLQPASTYGRTKVFVEHIIRDWAAARGDAAAVLLRYFNPAGAHASGQIGEDPRGIPNNLMPFMCQVMAGKYEALDIFGADYETRDGTGERDFVHVVDLARAHLAALRFAMARPGCEAVNVGAGSGVTVLEMMAAFERATGRTVPHRIVARRPGDIASMVADPARAAALLGWTATLDIDDMCRSAWAWQTNQVGD